MSSDSDSGVSSSESNKKENVSPKNGHHQTDPPQPLGPQIDSSQVVHPQGSHHQTDSSQTPQSDPRKTVTAEECSQYFAAFVRGQKQGLRKFYTEKDLQAKAEDAKLMVEELMRRGCKKEVAKQLLLLTLYDIVMLLDDSASMESEENGSRKITMFNTLREITKVYDLANSDGLLSVRFFSSDMAYRKTKTKNLTWLRKQCTYSGVTRIGSALRTKVLDRYVWNEGTKMLKPLIVMVITDGAVEGERKGLLRDVIADCAGKLEKDDTLGVDAVAFHFSHVGDDVDAKKLLVDLDNDNEIGKYTDCLDVTIRLQDISKDDLKWMILPKLLLGAIIREWDKWDQDIEVGDIPKVSSGNTVPGGDEEQDAGECEDEPETEF